MNVVGLGGVIAGFISLGIAIWATMEMIKCDKKRYVSVWITFFLGVCILIGIVLTISFFSANIFEVITRFSLAK